MGNGVGSGVGANVGTKVGTRFFEDIKFILQSILKSKNFNAYKK